MDIINQEMVWRQFRIAIDSLRDALRDCPDELWEKQLWQDQPDQWVARGFSKFWYLGLPRALRLDLYLTGAEEGFAPPAPFDLVEMNAAKSCREPIRARNCSTTWNSAAAGARRRSAL